MKISKHHQAMINSLAAFQSMVLDHNGAMGGQADNNVIELVRAFALDLNSFLKDCNIDLKVVIRKS